ncbi:sigma 54-interacting transcriptional regulator, partial [bacterium]|nr:sigma 54-interacting transcriptional regulator [bacterium]
MNRRITFFNSSAEAITGYSRHEVVGRDCHDAFPGNFCGEKCSFCDKCPSFERARYAVDFTTKTGEERLLEMSVRAIKDDNGNMLGVLASFRDLTVERDMARRLGEMESFSGMIGRDKKMLEIFDLIRSVADLKVPVLIQGETGTGKELVAAAIHNEGRRANKLFVPINCGALPEGLLESELFGHVRGAFTGAVRDKKGRFELADGGTIFLDEIGDVSPAMQVKLLRVLQEGAFERVGSTRTIHSDVRIISATNKNLKKEIFAGRFREDLYYRLCVVPIHLPPLRERCGDIPLLVDNIIKQIASETDSDSLSLSPAALDAVLSYEWPGN